MRSLAELKRFTSHHDNDDDRADVRAYLLAHAGEVAALFGVDAEKIRASVDGVSDDGSLVKRLLSQIDAAQRKQRDEKTNGKIDTAQRSANALAEFSAYWRGAEAHFDFSRVLSEVVTLQRSHVTFIGDGWTTAISMRRLLDIAKLRREDLSAFVDAKGLHVRFGKVGQLNLWPETAAPSDAIVFPLPVRNAEALAPKKAA